VDVESFDIVLIKLVNIFFLYISYGFEPQWAINRFLRDSNCKSLWQWFHGHKWSWRKI